jgi:hypothetical protein
MNKWTKKEKEKRKRKVDIDTSDLMFTETVLSFCLPCESLFVVWVSACWHNIYLNLCLGFCELIWVSSECNFFNLIFFLSWKFECLVCMLYWYLLQFVSHWHHFYRRVRINFEEIFISNHLILWIKDKNNKIIKEIKPHDLLWPSQGWERIFISTLKSSIDSYDF